MKSCILEYSNYLKYKLGIDNYVEKVIDSDFDPLLFCMGMSYEPGKG